MIETKCRGTPARHRQALGFQSYLPATAPAGIERHPLLQHHIIGNAEDRLFSDNSFDLIMADRVVEHIEPPDGFMAEMYSILRPRWPSADAYYTDVPPRLALASPR